MSVLGIVHRTFSALSTMLTVQFLCFVNNPIHYTTSSPWLLSCECYWSVGRNQTRVELPANEIAFLPHASLSGASIVAICALLDSRDMTWHHRGRSASAPDAIHAGRAARVAASVRRHRETAPREVGHWMGGLNL
jgi:hypothetical protein